jgi:transposase-like protein
MDFSGNQFPKEVIIMAVRWYLGYALSYRNIEELIKEWNIGLDHSSVQRWVAEYGANAIQKSKVFSCSGTYSITN